MQGEYYQVTQDFQLLELLLPTLARILDPDNNMPQNVRGKAF